MNRALKASFFAVGLVGLLLVVALGARGGHPTSDGQVASRTVPSSLQDSLVTLLAIAYVVAIAATLVVMLRFRHRWMEPQSRWLSNFVTVLVVMGLITAFGYWALDRSDFRRGAQEQAQRQQRQEQQNRERGIPRVREISPRSAEFQWPLAAALGGLVLLGVVLVAVRRRGTESEPVEPIEEEIARAVVTTIDDLRREPDPRRAVIAAYAQMERALAGHGLGRRRAEAPFEYLVRVLRDLRVREGSIRALTQLFEYARFSPHTVDERMKEDAIAALVAVRDDLVARERVAA